MPKKDAAQNALSIVEQITGAPLKSPDSATMAQTLDNAALRRQLMREMGRRGGKKGGVARAKSLSKTRLSAIAKAAAASRWKKKKDNRSK